MALPDRPEVWLDDLSWTSVDSIRKLPVLVTQFLGRPPRPEVGAGLGHDSQPGIENGAGCALSPCKAAGTVLEAEGQARRKIPAVSKN